MKEVPTSDDCLSREMRFILYVFLYEALYQFPLLDQPCWIPNIANHCEQRSSYVQRVSENGQMLTVDVFCARYAMLAETLNRYDSNCGICTVICH